MSLVILSQVYIYCIKIYGLKVTIITNILVIGFLMSIILTDFYSIVPLGTNLPSCYLVKIGNTEFLITDLISIFPTFIITFELGRISLKKTKNNSIAYQDILFISLLVSFYGFCFQMLLDISAAAVGLYYYLYPPELNILGYPIEFLLSFTIYGLWARIFLLIEKRYYLKGHI